MTIHNYWTLTTTQQEEIKTDHPVIKFNNKTYLVHGRLNIQTTMTTAYSFTVNVEVNAPTKRIAIEIAATRQSEQFSGMTHICWLNDGPTIKRQ